MKKINLRPVFLVLILATSLCSYIYINTVSINDVSARNVEQKSYFLGNEVENADSADEEKNSLPDVMLVKKLIEKGKGLFPAS
ncbi:MAG: hypothetical protein AAFV95_08810 [Bacteroidota bacterium]